MDVVSDLHIESLRNALHLRGVFFLLICFFSPNRRPLKAMYRKPASTGLICTLLCLPAAATVGLIHPVQAQEAPSCHLLHDMVAPPQVSREHLAPTGATCGTSLALDGTQSPYCHWEFDYRDPKANSFFTTLIETAKLCLKVESQPPQGATVNHPDTYTHRIFQTDGPALHISLKDKATLAKTFVFLRASAPEL